MLEETYKVGGMGCEKCTAHVKNAVEELSGVERCNVNLEKGNMTVKYDESKTGFKEMRDAVLEAGYGLERA